MTLTIYHNPQCSKSRKTLELIQERGITPVIVPYLDEAPTAATTLRLAAALSLPVKALLRTGEQDFKAAMDSLDVNDDRTLAEWLQEHPRLLERPIVIDEVSGKAVIGRPPENVLALLP
ncbi:MAG: arsenate reductase (glutaredoxin) [Halioglobus sp.]|nr:arsenate reductase (glutaredoxin) [Halioglobus sp.]